MMLFVVGGLLVIIVALVLYLCYMQQRIKEIGQAVRQLSSQNYQKLFVKGNSSLSLLAIQINDIERRHQEDLRRLDKAEQATKELMTSLSHDVRTPLTSLMGYLEALDNQILSKEEEQAYLGVARKKAYDLKNLVDTLFDWFKINSNEMKLQLNQIELCEQTRQILIGWLPILNQRNIECEIEVPEEDYDCYLDENAYARIVNNILQNSIEHSACTKLRIRLEKQEDYLELSIHDNGRGMTKEELSHIFERLYKTDAARNHKSTGLGLCIARQLAQMMHGDIVAESIVLKGSTFRIRIPVGINI